MQTNKISNESRGCCNESQWNPDIPSGTLWKTKRKNFLNSFYLPKLNQYISSPKQTHTKQKTEASIKRLSTRKSLGLGEFTAEFYQTIKETFTLVLLKLFYKVEMKNKIPANLLCSVSIILIFKPNKNTAKT